MAGVARQGTPLVERGDPTLDDPAVDLGRRLVEPLLQPGDVGLLEVEELRQILDRAERRSARALERAGLGADQLALAVEREAVRLQRRQAVPEATLVGIELGARLFEDRDRDRNRPGPARRRR